jgi:hypothetical protein
MPISTIRNIMSNGPTIGPKVLFSRILRMGYCLCGLWTKKGPKRILGTGIVFLIIVILVATAMMIAIMLAC